MYVAAGTYVLYVRTYVGGTTAWEYFVLHGHACYVAGTSSEDSVICRCNFFGTKLTQGALGISKVNGGGSPNLKAHCTWGVWLTQMWSGRKGARSIVNCNAKYACTVCWSRMHALYVGAACHIYIFLRRSFAPSYSIGRRCSFRAACHP